MQAPVNRLSKDKIIWLASHNCEHYHTYLNHYQCYLKDHPIGQKIGFLDIEASNLDANFGIMLSYCIKEAGKDKILYDVVTKDDLDTHLDKRIVKHCIEDILKFDLIVGYYSTKFDIPYIRTRALSSGLDFPEFGTIKHKDVYYMVKSKLKLNSNRLQTACKAVLNHSDKTFIESIYWIKALRGDKKSLSYILTHNKYDVIDLEKLYNKLIRFVGISQPSI